MAKPAVSPPDTHCGVIALPEGVVHLNISIGGSLCVNYYLVQLLLWV